MSLDDLTAKINPNITEFNFKRFFKLVRPHQKGVWLAFFGSIFGALIEGAIPAMVQPLVDSLTTQVLIIRGYEFPWWSVPLAIFLIFTFRAWLNYGCGIAMTQAISGMSLDLRNQTFRHLMYVHPKVFEEQPGSRLIGTITGATAGGISSLIGTTLTTIKEGLTLIFLLTYMFYAHWQLTLITLIVLPSAGIVIKFVRKKLVSSALSSQRAGDQLVYAVEENVLAYRIVRLQGIQQHQEQRFKGINDYLRELSIKMVKANIVTPVIQTVAALAIASIITLAMSLTRGGELTIGQFTAYLAAILALVPRIKSLSDIYASLQNGVIQMNRVYNLLDDPLEEDTGPHLQDRAKGNIDIQNLTKIYPNADRPALDNISFQIKAGETIALVGHSGSGKTTLVNMVPRFVDATSGQILLDGVPLEEWRLTSLRDQISMVSQDVILFNSSVAENVALGEAPEEIDQEKVKKALSMAHLLDFIETLPEGLQAPVGHNGHRFSGGQRQRLAIARALYRNTPILILDEATSALDSESERLVQLALESLTSERTTLIVAHRLSTIRNADRIIVMDEGHIIEMGTYEELIAKDSAFARLVEAQSAMQTAVENNS